MPKLVWFMPFFLILAPGVAAQVDCRHLENDSERLACYDAATSVDDGLDETEPEASAGESAETVLETRQREEMQLFENSFGIFPHRRSYILPLTYVRDINQQPYENLAPDTEDAELSQYEVKFQYSFKVPIGRRFLLGNDQLYFGFTQLSLWQAYNSELSAPFRENNYEPELRWEINLDEPLFSGSLSDFSLALNHQSNGRSGDLSRSWNRVTFDTTWADKNWAIGLQLWYRFQESEEEDDNPNIDEYLGYGKIRLGYKWKDYRFTSTLMNNLRSEHNRTSVELGISMPISRKLRGFVQYYNGYGETLIDYNYRTKRIGVGVLLSDWF